jgi:glycosyltransferase involved in cell wall biosynthesis
LLFFKEAFAWPRSKGHDIHCFYMMRAVERLGHEVSLVTLAPPPSEALQGLNLAMVRVLSGAGYKTEEPPPALSRFQERFRSYWGVETAHIHEVGRAARDCRADAVVAVGLSVLPFLAAVQGAMRVWYAADEWAWHHLSQVRLFSPSSWHNLRQGLLKGFYERAYAPLLDRVWMVSEADRKAMRWVAGVRNVDMVPYGLDGDVYRPQGQPQAEHSCVFWGRLDFGPNIQAVEWFTRRVWPAVRAAAPDARFSIYGFNPSAAVSALSGRDGITVVPNLPDLRAEVDKNQVVVLPMVSGGGVKNKLLEAAGMAKAIVCSPRACGGLHMVERQPFLVANTPDKWVGGIKALWADEQYRHRLGIDARQWVLEHHTWEAAARQAAAGLVQLPGGPGQ